MKRTIPLLITAVAGFAIVVSFFSPHVAYFLLQNKTWGETVAIWFDILASIAFVLGGGNLLKIHLKKVSDRPAGWGYSLVTIVAFLVMLGVGLAKVGSRPATEQQFYGETFVRLDFEDFPDALVTRIDGTIPSLADGSPLPPSVRRQLTQENGQLAFRGWMSPNQKKDLSSYQDELAWQCRVEELSLAAQPLESLRGKLNYYIDYQSLSFRGFMTEDDEQELRALADSAAWQHAVDQLAAQSRRVTSIPVERLPDGIAIPSSLESVVSFDAETRQLGIKGPMSTAQRDALAGQFAVVKPFSQGSRSEFVAELEERGSPLTERQRTALRTTFDALWSVEQLRDVIDAAGQPQEVSKTACEMLAEKDAGVKVIDPQKSVGEETQLNEAQVVLLGQFTDDSDMTPEALSGRLKQAGTFTPAQQAALSAFLAKMPTEGKFRKEVCFALLRAGALATSQRDWLLETYRAQHAWRSIVGALFVRAHVSKFRWSGHYSEQGNPFWWMYEYAFKPLTATMFAMLAFYVASAAFRAFRAKNIEASLLLATAFIVLLGRTFAGVQLTAWLPDSLSGLRIENLTVYIMNVFNTAGNRAIMIGIALGLASTSLKVLLGVDRSYLGSQED